MNIDYKIKKVTLETALSILLKSKIKSKERVARNIIEIGTNLSKKIFSENELQEIYNNLLIFISKQEYKQITEYTVNTFLL